MNEEGLAIEHLANQAANIWSTTTDAKSALNEWQWMQYLLDTCKTVDEAIDRLISDLDLQDKVNIANMSLDELVNLHPKLHVYFKNAFGVWSGNTELLADCRSISKEPIYNEHEATVVIFGVLWQKLRETHKLKVVK